MELLFPIFTTKIIYWSQVFPYPKSNVSMSVFIDFLLKLNYNYQMAWSIIHGPVETGEPAWRNTYKTQGVKKLYLFLDHLHLRDCTRKFIHINLSYVPRWTGSSTFFLNQKYIQCRWIEIGWIRSLSDFINKAGLPFVYLNLWLPTKPPKLLMASMY